MPRTTNARRLALETAGRLFRTQGYAATGLTQILEESGAPKGSFYFHFPGGKLQVAHEVLEAYGAQVTAGMTVLAHRFADNPKGFVTGLCNGAAREMQAANWGIGCAAQNLANELAPSHADVATRIAAIFEAWSLVAADVLGDRAKGIALVAALEGARTLARVSRSRAPFDAVADQFG